MTTLQTHTATPPRDTWQAFWRGLRGRCPNCGQRHMFRAFLKGADTCPACGEELHHQQGDDAPAYLVILIVGHIVVPLALVVETEFAPPMWVHWSLWIPMTLGLAIGFLQPVKGAIVALQWAYRMHGFGSTDEHLDSEPRWKVSAEQGQ